MQILSNYYSTGNALTLLAKSISVATLQADGTTRSEKTMDVQHVADAIVHIAELPTNVQVLQMNIMCVARTCLQLRRLLSVSRTGSHLFISTTFLISSLLFHHIACC